MERTTEQRILVTMRKILAQIVRETTPQPGLQNPLSTETLKDIRKAFELISARERELMEESGETTQERPRYADEPKTSHAVRVPAPPRKLDS